MSTNPFLDLDVPFSQNSIFGTGKYTYTENDFRFRLYQPNLVRQRHQFRSPRNSLKINQEIGQTNFDLYNIDRKKDSLRKTTHFYLDKIMKGWDLDENVEFYNDSISDTIDGNLIGLEALYARVESLRLRTRNLEGH